MAHLKTRVQDLAVVMSMLKTLELARLSEISARKAVVVARIDALKNARKPPVPAGAGTTEPDISDLLGVNGKWARWLDGQIGQQYSNLAGLEAEFEAQKQACKFALGRQTAVEKMITTQKNRRKPSYL